MTIVVIAKLNASGDARQKVISALDNVARYSKQNEPGVLRHCTMIPRDMSDEKSIYVIEEYNDQAAFDAHMSAKPTTDLIAYFGENPTLFSAPTEIAMSDPESSFVRPECARAADPWVVYATIDGNDGTRDDALRALKAVASESQENELGTLSHDIFKDKNGKLIHILEVYKSEQNSHNRTKYDEQGGAACKSIVLKIAAGYMHREGKASPNL